MSGRSRSERVVWWKRRILAGVRVGDRITAEQCINVYLSPRPNYYGKTSLRRHPPEKQKNIPNAREVGCWMRTCGLFRRVGVNYVPDRLSPRRQVVFERIA